MNANHLSQEISITQWLHMIEGGIISIPMNLATLLPIGHIVIKYLDKK